MRFKLFSIFFISCLGIIVYSNTFHYSFSFDDTPSILNNFAIRNIHDLQSIWNFLPRRFILYLSVALNYHFDRYDGFGYHLFNLTVHLISALLVWWLTLLTLSTPAMKKEPLTVHADLLALFVGLIFVSHPLQTEAVTYIVQRAASMATLFYVATLCFYIRSRLLLNENSNSGIGKLYYVCALITAVVAMFTKETAITLPLMILLYEFSFLKTNKSINWRGVAPFLLTICIIPLTIFFTESPEAQQMRGVVPDGPPGISSAHYLFTQFRVILTYIRLLFLPFNQNLDYDYPIAHSLFELPVLASFLFLAVILIFTLRLFSKHRLVCFSILWIFIALIPESSLLPIKDVIFEHRLYLPLVGFSMFLASSAYYLGEKKSIKIMFIALSLIIACFSVLTYQRNKIWKNEFALWDDTIQKSPHKSRPYNGRGLAYYDQNNYSKAKSDFNKAIDLDPKDKSAYNNRGVIYLIEKNFDQALSDYNNAIDIDPQYAQAYNNRGLAYDKLGKLARAILDYSKAIDLNPRSDEAYNNRGFIYAEENKFSEAISDYNKAIELNSNYTEAHFNRGNAYDKLGNISQAISDLNKVIEINPEYAEAYNNRGGIYSKENNFTQAMFDLDQAIKLNPNFAETYYNRATIYAKQGNFDQALSDFNKAIDLKPDYAQAFYNRGIMYAKQKELIQAMSDFNKAIEIKPDYAEAYNNRSFIYGVQGNYSQAMLDSNKAIEINPSDAEAYFNLAVSYYQLKEYDTAIQDVHKAQDLGFAVDPGFINSINEAMGQGK